jgi:hypothetical protein
VAVVKDNYTVVAKTGQCPECGQVLRAAFDGEDTNLLCPTCRICWHDELGWITRVNPKTCPGCSLQGVCTGAHRQYGAPVPD